MSLYAAARMDVRLSRRSFFGYAAAGAAVLSGVADVDTPACAAQVQLGAQHERTLEALATLIPEIAPVSGGNDLVAFWRPMFADGTAGALHGRRV